MHRHALIILALTATIVPASAEQRRIFVSPMGQPFHGNEAAPDPERAWFTAVDANGDGTITSAEFQADATRFFATLDRKHDGEIDPDDIEYYENTIAPEVRSSDGGRSIIARSSSAGSDGAKGQLYDAGKLGAARFSYFDLPEPVTAADRNFNRGIDPHEFADAADKRFSSLDTKKNGGLTWDELSHVTNRATAPMKRGRGRHRGGRGGGRGEGFGGGDRMPGGED